MHSANLKCSLGCQEVQNQGHIFENCPFFFLNQGGTNQLRICTYGPFQTKGSNTKKYWKRTTEVKRSSRITTNRAGRPSGVNMYKQASYATKFVL